MRQGLTRRAPVARAGCEARSSPRLRSVWAGHLHVFTYVLCGEMSDVAIIATATPTKFQTPDHRG